jgi:Tol biopolymer transport system component
MKPDGSDKQRLTCTGDLVNENSNPDWSPDGTRIVFSRDGKIVVMNADGSEQKVLYDYSAGGVPGSNPSWSPDGSRIVFAHFTSIDVMNADGTDRRPLIGMDSTNRDTAPVWSPNGDRIAFTDHRGSPSLDIYTIDTDGTGLTNLTNSSNVEETTPSWSPDGNAIAFTSNGFLPGSSSGSDIYAMNADGTNAHRLTFTGASYDPSWSPDGSRIAFVKSGGQAQIATMNTDGADVTVLTDYVQGASRPTWQPVPASLTVAANNQARLVGRANPPLTYSITGFVRGDTSTVVSGTATCTTPATPTSAVGTYPITCSAGTLDAHGYGLGPFVPGTLTVTDNPTCVDGADSAPPPGDATTTCTFGFTGAEQLWVVPDGVSKVNVVATGAGGGQGNSYQLGGAPAPGGKGARLRADLPVTPGQVLYIDVGGMATAGRCQGVAQCVGGFNGGGGSAISGGGGGGASDLRTMSSSTGTGSLASRLIVAAGGGGGGSGEICSNRSANGGAGGSSGSAGQTADRGGTGGGAGTTSSGGTAGSPGGQAGTLGSGGLGGSDAGGGGGGGLYGGGGGGAPVGGGLCVRGSGGGGGGASYAATPVTAVELTDGVGSGNGQLTITYADEADPVPEPGSGRPHSEPPATTARPATELTPPEGARPPRPPHSTPR